MTSVDKMIRKQKYKDNLVNRDAYIISIMNRGEEARYEDPYCEGYFEIGLNQNSIYIYNLILKNKFSKKSIK